MMDYQSDPSLTFAEGRQRWWVEETLQIVLSYDNLFSKPACTSHTLSTASLHWHTPCTFFPWTFSSSQVTVALNCPNLYVVCAGSPGLPPLHVCSSHSLPRILSASCLTTYASFITTTTSTV